MSGFADVSNRIQPKIGWLIYFSVREAYSGCAIPGWDAKEQRWTCVQCWAVFEYLPNLSSTTDRPVYQVLCPFCQQKPSRQELLRAVKTGFELVCQSRSLELWQSEFLSASADDESLGDSLSLILCGPEEGLIRLRDHLRWRYKQQKAAQGGPQ